MTIIDNPLLLLTSRPARGARIEIALFCDIVYFAGWSRPARGARIEIMSADERDGIAEVAPRTGRED